MGNFRKMAVYGLVAVLALSGCGKLAQKALQRVTGCENIDFSDKGAKAKCQGNSFDSSGHAEFPTGFPDALKPPAGSETYAALKGTTDGHVSYDITMVYEGDPTAVANKIRGKLRDLGFTITSDTLTATGAGSLEAKTSKLVIRYDLGEDSSSPSTTVDTSTGTFVNLTVTDLSTTVTTTTASGG